MKQHPIIWHFLIGGRHFKEEFRKQMRLLIIFTIGFTIAFSWRQTIFDITQTAVQKFFNTQNFFYSTLFTSLTITIFGIIIIFLTSHLLKIKTEGQ